MERRNISIIVKGHKGLIIVLMARTILFGDPKGENGLMSIQSRVLGRSEISCCFFTLVRTLGFPTFWVPVREPLW